MFRLASLLLIVGLLCPAQAQNSLTLTGVSGSGTPVPAVSFVGPGQVHLSVASITNTFSIGVGAATSSRYIIVGASMRGSSAASSLASATICGVSATIHVANAAGSEYSNIIGAAVPTGTTCNLVLNQNAGVFTDIAISVWRKVGTSSNTPNDTNTVTSVTTADPAWSFGVNILTDGIGIFVQTNQIGANANWSGATAVYTASTSGGQSGFADSVTTGMPHTVTDPNAGMIFDGRYAVGAAWVVN